MSISAQKCMTFIYACNQVTRCLPLVACGKKGKKKEISFVYIASYLGLYLVCIKGKFVLEKAMEPYGGVQIYSFRNYYTIWM
jgi:hypothetical protein